MNSFHLTFVIFITGIQFMFSVWFLCRGIERKHHYWCKVLFFVGLMFLYVFFAPLEKMKVFIHMPNLLLGMMFIKCAYELSTSTCLFIGTACGLICNIGSLICSMVTLAAPEKLQAFGNDIAPNWLGYSFMQIGYFIALIVIYFMLIRRMEGVSYQKLATFPVVVMSITMFIVNGCMGLWFELYAAPNANGTLHMLEYIWNLLFSIACLLLQFNIFHINRQNEELNIVRHLMAEKERQYEISKNTMEVINRKCHNLKYQISAISHGEGGKNSLDEAIAVIDSFDSQIHTGNMSLDVIFNEKGQYIQEKNITFICMVDGEKLNFMEVSDLYILFGNIIDNAIHAVEKIEELSKRMIYLDVHMEGKLLLIKSENSYVGEILFEGDIPKTETGDDLNHGYGIKSMKLITEKYHGSMNVKTDNNQFYLKIVIPQ